MLFRFRINDREIDFVPYSLMIIKALGDAFN
ncbi:MAG: hypothetical protein H6Q59_249 [Firmicutes bacterium]|nr:hypothetical protein [Bacillota bacterium]